MTTAFRRAWRRLRVHDAAGTLRGAQRKAVEAEILESFRSVYRHCWNQPHMRQVLSQTSNLMVWSDLEVCANFTDIGGLEEASQDALKQQHELHTDPEPRAAAASLRTLVRLAHQVYREYQRQLFDPAVVKLGDAGVSWCGRDGAGIVCLYCCSSALAPLDLLALRLPHSPRSWHANARP